MRRILIAFSFFFSTPLFATPLWEDIDNAPHAAIKTLKTLSSPALPTYIARNLLLDETALRKQLFIATNNNQTARYPQATNRPTHNDKIFNLPLPDGSMLEVIATEYSLMEKSLANRFPNFKSWKVQATKNKKIQGNMSFTANGFNAMLILENGDTIFIDPNKSIEASIKQFKQNKKPYRSFSKRENKHLFQHKFPLKEIVIQPPKNQLQTLLKPQARAAKALITYRLALAATAEYTALSHGTKESALSAMYVTIDRVNTIYRRDLSIQLQLVDTDKLIYLNRETDPYNNGDSYQMLDENIANLDAVIGKDNYDIGHVFGGEGTGGLALMSSVCKADQGAHKAGGVTGSLSPYGSTFDIDYVAHEMGHQFGATHTFNSIKESCGGNNREPSSAVEPGSGSTIMSYAGICAADNLQANSDAVFHAVSIQQINDYIRYSGEATCGTKSNTDNNNPTISSLKNYYIPIKTPFLLKANASDIDISNKNKDDVLTYTWDQIDVNGTTVELGIDAGDNPLFRSYMPSSSNQRYFPQLASLFGQPTPSETMPLTNRELNFATTVRDGKGGVARADTKIMTSGNQAFEVTSHKGKFLYHIDDKIEVKWNEANTSWAPINCNSVDIKLLTEDGTTQDLLLNIPNDGSETITVTQNTHPINNAHIMVACSDNIFFAISKGKITIDHRTANQTTTIDNVNSPSPIEEDSGSKTLNYIISFNNIFVAEGNEGITKATFTVYLNQVATVDTFIDYATISDSAQADSDFNAKSGTLSILAGKISGTISIDIKADQQIENDEIFWLLLSNPSNNTVLSNKIASATIINDDKKIEITADKEAQSKNSAGGSFDGILTFLLIYISLLRLKFKARRFSKKSTPPQLKTEG